jgi:single-strand DNA-binding protein
MNETMMTVSGNLVSDVDFRVTARGDALARFRVACTIKRYDRASGQWLDGDTTYWNVTAWRRAAENAAKSLAKGHPVVVHGKVRQRTVDREVAGAPGTTMAVTFTDLEAVSFGLDLTRCRALYQRAPIGPQTGRVEGESPVGHGDAGQGQHGVGEGSMEAVEAAADPVSAAAPDAQRIDAA